MAKLTDQRITDAFKEHLQPGEELQYQAFGVKQPHIGLMIGLFTLAILPGVIAVTLLTKNYLIGLTSQRLIVIRIKSFSDATPVEVTEYSRSELSNMETKASTGALFTRIRIIDSERPFSAKFHRAFSKTNRPHAKAIAESLTKAAA